jgi:hypothetical protein
LDSAIQARDEARARKRSALEDFAAVATAHSERATAAEAERGAIAATLEQLRAEIEQVAGFVAFHRVADLLHAALDRHKALATTPPSTVAGQNPPVPQEGTDTPQAVQDDPGAREGRPATMLRRVDFDTGPECSHGHPWHDPNTIDHLAAMQDATPRDPKAEGSPALSDEDELHKARRHPDYEYETTECQRKSMAYPPPGEGWELNVYGGDHHTAWERFDWHEEHYWRRRRAHSDGTATWTNREAGS